MRRRRESRVSHQRHRFHRGIFSMTKRKVGDTAKSDRKLNCAPRARLARAQTQYRKRNYIAARGRARVFLHTNANYITSEQNQYSNMHTTSLPREQDRGLARVRFASHVRVYMFCNLNRRVCVIKMLYLSVISVQLRFHLSSLIGSRARTLRFSSALQRRTVSAVLN